MCLLEACKSKRKPQSNCQHRWGWGCCWTDCSRVLHFWNLWKSLKRYDKAVAQLEIDVAGGHTSLTTDLSYVLLIIEEKNKKRNGYTKAFAVAHALLIWSYWRKNCCNELIVYFGSFFCKFISVEQLMKYEKETSQIAWHLTHLAVKLQPATM